MKISTSEQAHAFLNQFIPQGPKQIFSEDIGLRRAKHLLNLLGNPQNNLKVIHIAGTSGKGSTCTLISTLLKDQGFSVGLSISPHLFDLRERFQINNQLIANEEFCKYLTELVPSIEQMCQSEVGKPTYFEITTALAYYIFYKKKVDYAVIETGLGGWYDATNVVKKENKVVVITKIGLDHTKILGNTLSKIALQKIMITQQGNTVFTIDQKPQVIDIFKKVVKEKKAELFTISKPKNVKNINLKQGKLSFDFKFREYYLQRIQLQSLGLFQVENSSLALATVIFLSQRDKFIINEEKLRHTLATLTIQGRMELISLSHKKIIIDGAHNPQKMSAFIQSLTALFPHREFNFLIAFKRGKDYEQMLKYIVPVAKNVIVTTFYSETQGITTASTDPKAIEKILKEQGCRNIKIVSETDKALQTLLQYEGNSVITGSLYLIGELYSQVQKIYKTYS